MTTERNNSPRPNRHLTPSSVQDVDCEQLRSLIPSYSIGATDPEETALVEALLPYCPEAATELTDHLVLAEELLYLPSEALSPVLSSFDALPQLPPLSRPQVTATPTLPPRSSLPNRAARRRSQWLPLSVAAVLVLVLFGVSSFYWLRRVQSLQDEQLLLLGQLQAQVALPSLASGQVHHRELLPNQAVNIRKDAHATLIWNSAREVGSVYVTGLPALTPDKTYQFWLVRDGGTLSLGTFRVDESGVGTLIFEAPERIEGFQHIGISEEPAAGSAMPTTPHLVIGSI